jgi:hypothetical protein
MDTNQERSNTMAATQAVRIAVQSHAQAAERRNLMGANRTQGLGITFFLIGFTALSGALYSGKAVLYLVAVASIALSIWAFRKVKPLENSEN